LTWIFGAHTRIHASGNARRVPELYDKGEEVFDFLIDVQPLTNNSALWSELVDSTGLKLGVQIRIAYN
jgi:hypothetical protein